VGNVAIEESIDSRLSLNCLSAKLSALGAAPRGRACRPLGSTHACCLVMHRPRLRTAFQRAGCAAWTLAATKLWSAIRCPERTPSMDHSRSGRISKWRRIGQRYC